MKIGFDSKRLFCNFTGLGNYSRTLVRNLCHFYPENDYFLYSSSVKDTDETNEFLDNPELNIRISEALLKSFWRSFSIKDQLIKDEIDLYHGLSHEIPFKLKKTGIKSVVTIHDLIFKYYPETYSSIDRKIYDLKFRYACQHADRIIAISENTKQDIVRFYGINPDKIDVIYQACNPAYYKLRSKVDNDRIIKKLGIPADFLLSVGTVEPRKNLKKVLEALTWVKRELQVPLVVVGKGRKYKHEAESFARQAGLEKPVIWIDNLENILQLQALYQGAKALIYPSMYEGFGLPVAEALLCKTPVITSAGSSLKEAGGPGSLYVNPKDAQEIAAAIEKILTDESFRQKMIETGYLYAHQVFAPDHLTRQVINCYKKTLEA
jgi:glycosyltransferase involved in cell wall biosynthesis